MKVAVIGLGRIGIVTAAALLRDGHYVVGVDINDDICQLLRQGMSPFNEPGIQDLIASGRRANRLIAGTRLDGVDDADIAFICVGTKGAQRGLDLSDVTRAAHTLGEAVRGRRPEQAPMLMVFRSTVPPGSMRHKVVPSVATAANEPPGTRYEIVYSPEFTREGTALADYFSPSRIVVGEERRGSSDVLRDLHPSIEAPIFRTSFEVAELTKLADNAFHALKVTFANEIGRFALASGLSPSEVFAIFQADAKLNLSAAYLQPGGAFGGPCLPKDVRALATCLDDAGVAAPIIGHIEQSNAAHTRFLVSEIERRVEPRSHILLFGLSFKTGTDELRESPFIVLADALLSRGHVLTIYDPDLCYAGVTRARASLTAQLAPLVVEQRPSDTPFDLVVVAKNRFSQESPPPGCPVFRIDRL
jgi:GDP-mannose 6-dehydrogenase